MQLQIHRGNTQHGAVKLDAGKHLAVEVFTEGLIMQPVGMMVVNIFS